MQVSQWMFRAAALLWVVWGIVHVVAGGLTLALPTADAIAGIADAADAAAIAATTYPDALGAILHQHGFNLAWIGLTTLFCAVPVWRGQAWAVGVAALVGGLADLGYFLFLDLGGLVHFLPGGLMTVVSATAIGLSGLAVYREW